MKWHLACTLALCNLYVVFCQPPDLPRDSLSSVLWQEFKAEADANDRKGAVNLFKEHRLHIRYDAQLFDDVVNYFLEKNRTGLAGEVLKTNPFLMSQHNEQALYHYYLGVSQMLDRRGWPNFKQAEKSLNRAITEMKRSYTPDYGFFSDVENARGYLSIVARGESTNEDKELVCVVRSEFIEMAIYHFREALIYNPENEYAQRNLDTLLSKLHQAGLPIPPHKYEMNVVPGHQVSLDSVNADSLNDLSLMPVLDYRLLPQNYQLILSELSVYDEIVLLFDLSGSMDDPVGWSNEASKFRVAQQLAIFIALNLRVNVFLGAISVGQACDQHSMVLNYPIAGVSRTDLVMQLDAIRPYGPTPLDQRLILTKDMFSSRTNRKLVFLLSDGMDTCGDIPDLCGTAATLAANGIDLSVFSFIYESLDPESRTAYAIYNCMVAPSEGKIYKITGGGAVEDQIDYEPVSNNILVLPPLDTSYLWSNNPGLYQFDIPGVEPPVEQILRFDRDR